MFLDHSVNLSTLDTVLNTFKRSPIATCVMLYLCTHKRNLCENSTEISLFLFR